MHDSFMPLSGGILLANMMVDEVIVGAPGSGLFGMLLFCVVAVFLAELMIGRTPEYVGKKIRSSEVKMTLLALIAVPFATLGLTAVACVVEPGLAGLGNAGPHGFSEILYAYTSAAATNGSAFAGLNANSPFYNLTLALGMFVGRFFVIIPVLALAGSLAAQPVSALKRYAADGRRAICLVLARGHRHRRRPHLFASPGARPHCRTPAPSDQAPLIRPADRSILPDSLTHITFPLCSLIGSVASSVGTMVQMSYVTLYVANCKTSRVRWLSGSRSSSRIVK